MCSCYSILSITALCFISCNLSQPLGTTVFAPGEGGYPCIRIPAITSTPNGTLIAFAECRGWIGDGCDPKNYEQYNKYSASTNDRWVCSKLSNDNGKSWSNLSFPVGIKYTSMEPTIVYDYIENKLILQINAFIGQSNQSVLQTISYDGNTWSQPLDIGNLYLKNNKNLIVGPGTGLQLINNPNSKYYGRILFIGYQGTYADARVWYSDDGGKSYNLSPTVLSKMDESALVELNNGSVAANMRNDDLWNCDCRGIAMSNDGGTTFTDPYPETQLISPICEGSTISLNNGSIILFSNPQNKESRINMTVKLSMNNGNSYNKQYILCPSCGGGYSCLTTLKQDGYFGLLWETNMTDCSGASCQSIFTVINYQL